MTTFLKINARLIVLEQITVVALVPKAMVNGTAVPVGNKVVVGLASGREEAFIDGEADAVRAFFADPERFLKASTTRTSPYVLLAVIDLMGDGAGEPPTGGEGTGA